MSERKDKKLNQDDELAQLRSLIGDADSGSYSLDDILSEYSSHKLPSGVVSLSPEPDNLIPFPGTVCTPEQDEMPMAEETSQEEEANENEVTVEVESDEDESDEDEYDEDEYDEDGDEDAYADNVVDFPAQPSLFQRWLQTLSRKADRY
ncbi:MAG: hypothetical protein J6Q14_04610, partial [Oscillospiraceae bacterium]|nr:hypothetical protein [Oscillospiraceae bacterium]